MSLTAYFTDCGCRFHIRCSSPDVKYQRCVTDGVSNVQTAEDKDVYYVGETVNCTADAYPLPSFVWTPIMAQVGREVQGSVLTITEAMIGDNKWTCSVTNTITKQAVTITVVFTVGQSITYLFLSVHDLALSVDLLSQWIHNFSPLSRLITYFFKVDS